MALIKLASCEQASGGAITKPGMLPYEQYQPKTYCTMNSRYCVLGDTPPSLPLVAVLVADAVGEPEGEKIGTTPHLNQCDCCCNHVR
eukprot:3740294-Amphidinium_carterae.1